MTPARLAGLALRCAVVTGLATAPAFAQITEKQAIASAKAATKEKLATFKSALDDAKAVLGSQINAFETTVGTGGMSIDLVQELFDHVQDMQRTIQAAREQLVGEIAAAQSQLLVDLADGADLEPVPASFVNGARGVADAWRLPTDELLRKFYLSVNKRLDKTEAFVGQHSTRTLLAWVGPPGRTPVGAAGDDEVTSSVNELDIDTLMSSSDTTVDDDGRLWVGGPTPFGFDDVRVDAVGVGDNPDFDFEIVSPTTPPKRFATLLDNGGVGLGEANYLVLAKVAADSAARSQSIGIR